MTRKLFKKHNVVNVYFEGKVVEDDDKIIERDIFRNYIRLKTIQICGSASNLFGNLYLFPYHHGNHKGTQVYLKVGTRNILTQKQLMDMIKRYIPTNKKITIRIHEFKFKNSHYTIEMLKFVGYAWGCLVRGNITEDKKFRDNILRRYIPGSGDKLSKEQKKRLSPDEWLNLIHHMFLSLDIDYNEEALIYGLGKERIQYNINKSK